MPAAWAHSFSGYLSNLPHWGPSFTTCHGLSPPTWVDAEGALDEAAPHAGGGADDGVHVREELHGTQWEAWCRAVLTQIMILIALERR